MPAPDREPVLRCDHLVRFYETASGRVQAVRGVDLEVAAGEITAVVGPSGCGKSSLLRMLAGIDRPTAGSIVIDGVDLARLGTRARARVRAATVTHVHQRPGDNLLGHLTTLQQLERVARRRNGAVGAPAVLELLGLADRSDVTPDAMSGGARQRLAFGRALVSGHRVVIADEPTAHLDADAADTVLGAIELVAARGVTVVVATHDRRVLERVHRVVALRDGAVATITEAGSALSIIDGSGRIQLPPDALELFADRRARLSVDPSTGSVVLEQP